MKPYKRPIGQRELKSFGALRKSVLPLERLRLKQERMKLFNNMLKEIKKYHYSEDIKSIIRRYNQDVKVIDMKIQLTKI